MRKYAIGARFVLDWFACAKIPPLRISWAHLTVPEPVYSHELHGNKDPRVCDVM